MTAHTLLSRRLFGLALASSLITPALAQAPAWPNKPVRWVVAYPAFWHALIKERGLSAE